MLQPNPLLNLSSVDNVTLPSTILSLALSLAGPLLLTNSGKIARYSDTYGRIRIKKN